MNKRFYTSPEVEIDSFFLSYKVCTLSGIVEDGGAIDETGSDFKGDGDWDF